MVQKNVTPEGDDDCRLRSGGIDLNEGRIKNETAEDSKIRRKEAGELFCIKNLSP